MDRKQKSLHKADITLNLLSSKLKLPDYIKDQSYKLYKEALYKDYFIGRDNTAILHACVYASCIIHNLPKTAAEITEDSEIDVWKLLRAYKLLNKNLKITTYNPVDLLPRFISKLNLSQKTLTKSIIIMNKIENNKILQGKNPKSIIAAVIYISAKLNNEKIAQRIISHHTGVIEETIRKRYKEIVKMLEVKV